MLFYSGEGNNYRIEGERFIVIEQSGQLRTIIGYPTWELTLDPSFSTLLTYRNQRTADNDYKGTVSHKKLEGRYRFADHFMPYWIKDLKR